MKCGLYESDITPHFGSEIPGHFRVRPANGIKERLFCHAAYFENDGGEKAVIISSDSILVPDDLADRARGEIAEKLAMKKACVLFCATHSHTAGPVETWGDFFHEDLDYLRFFERRLVDAAIMAAGAAREVNIGYASGHEDKIAYYRIYKMSDGSVRTNPGPGDPGMRPYGDIDNEVGVLRIDNTDGTPYGALVNYACHCDCVGGGTAFSSDYPGELKAALKRQYGSGFNTVFINGFCGNINHRDAIGGFSTYPEHYKRMGRMLAADVMRTRELSVPFEDNSIDGADCTLTLYTRVPGDELIKWADECLKKPAGEVNTTDLAYAGEFKRMKAAGAVPVPSTVQVVRIGELAVFGMPGEIFVEFGLELKKSSPVKYNMHANLANGCIGYIPIKELFLPGVYEARPCKTSQMEPEAGYIMTDKLIELVKTI